ncbi:MAG: hypothetical protein GEU98_13945 [Pseudonocardiaceae bacterium]|nr:hypothetical protein [Pseudonocardiaceae bacterium]
MSGGPSHGSSRMETESVGMVAEEFGKFSEALQQSATYAGDSQAKQEHFGGLPETLSVGNDVIGIVQTLAKSLGYVARFTDNTRQALMQSAGLVDNTDQDSARNLNRQGGGI